VRTQGIQLLPGVYHWLQYLHAHGWQQAIASAAPRENIETIIDVLDIGTFFNAVVSAEDVQRGKPDPQVFLTAAARVGVPAPRCIVIEDAPAGIEGAHRAGMASIGVTTNHTHLKSNREVQTLEELFDDAFEELLADKQKALINRPSIITIDGPAATGKSTLGEMLAQRLDYLYFDTGVMYRAVTLVALQQKQDCHDSIAMERLAQQTSIDVVSPTEHDGRQYTVLVNGKDVTWDIRTPDVERFVSLISSHPSVRTELIRQQRIIGERGEVVMVGRDIGTIVMPDASLKIYLQTSLEERACRRLIDQHAKGYEVTLEQVKADIARRDELDQHVMQPASDALILNTDMITPIEGVDWIIAHFDTSVCLA